MTRIAFENGLKEINGFPPITHWRKKKKKDIFSERSVFIV